MDHERFEMEVARVFDELPDWVRAALRNIDIVVRDAPGPELDPHGEGLLGLYVGQPLTERCSDGAGELPDVIYIFREAHLDLGLAESGLRAEIRKTLLHEIAHYFGLDDAHLHEIGWG